MEWFTIIVYILAVYGLSNIIVFGEGPFYILERWRELMYNIHPNIGKLFSCMMCLPSNLGWLISLIDWFLIPVIAFTPFNIVFAGTGLWWLAMILDMGFTSGICWLLYVIDDYFEKKTSYYEDVNNVTDENNTDENN